MSQITGPQMRIIHAALLEAFPSTTRFDQMLLFQLNVNRQSIALGSDLGEIILKVIIEFNATYQIPQLIQAARTTNPHHPALLAAEQEVIWRHVVVEQQGINNKLPIRSSNDLERFIRTTNRFQDTRQWREGMAQAENAICRVEILRPGADPIFGTAFLIGPDLVLTNYHVIELVHAREVPALNVQLRFDFAVLADGVSPNPGTIYKLDPVAWLVNHSPYSYLDTIADPQDDPAVDHLDFAVLRVDGKPGDEPIGGSSNLQPDARPRGYLPLRKQGYAFTPNSPLFILQHPAGAELKLALDTEAVVGINGNGTRVRYRTNTEAGSSGSPCFDDRWNLVALHQAGDPKFAPLYHPQYNQGIPIDAILNLLTKPNEMNPLPP